MKEFVLEVLSPERAFYMGPCVSLTVPLDDGMLGIMADREPITAAIADGEVHFTKPDGTVVTCAVTRGMVDVSPENVRLLCGTALAPDEIDEEKERQAMEEARIALSTKQSQRDYKLSQLALSQAINRLRVKKHDADKLTNF